ncbi:SPFH domain-containing protein [Planctobacterium marinum]|uniref:Membrane protein n=1 Tax=Planctobacterium marinum TaxID=1631968 RepID=A0AA48KUA0_9ALTE|nr:membrane protein [Planctobacterium marinum]
MITEKRGFSVNGYAVFAVLMAIIIWIVFSISDASSHVVPVSIIAKVVIAVAIAPGFFMVQPNQGKVMTLFGSYVGTVRETGLRWTIPLFIRKNISLRIRNFESAKIKVNDKNGNPIEIASIVVWAVTDTAEAVFEVDDYESYVSIQSEAAIRNLANIYSYDPSDENEIGLRSDPVEIAERLKSEVQDRLERAGVTVQEARISHLAYAQEIASAMLQRQQAEAIIAARAKIVEGAVGMVDMAISKLAEKDVIQLDEERKATMVSNLLVVLCGDKATQPVVNTGTLY